MELTVPSVYKPLWKQHARYYFIRGGRGSGKSWAVADYLIIRLLQNPNLNLVCLREVQRSIDKSSKKLLEDRINTLNLGDYFEITRTEIRTKKGRGIIIFNGLQDHTVDSIKSLEGFDLCWVEEAQTISEYSLELLIPTIRAKNSKLFFTYNPQNETDPIEQLKAEKENKVVIHSTYLDNNFVPDAIVEEAEEMKSKRLSKYNHIYLGQYGQAEGLIFENVEYRMIRESEIKGLICVQGLDFGYTNDPSAFCINYIDEKNKIFYVFDGFYKKGLLNSQIAEEIKKLQAHKHIIYADSAEPKSIETLRIDGITRIRPAIKGKDSVNAGIDFLLDYTIIINSHLKDFKNEADNYTWEVDRKTKQPTNKPVDKFNHFWDSCFSGDTKVIVNNKLMKFEDIPREGLIRGYNGENVKYTNGGLIRYDKLFDIKLNNGIIIKSTPDHEFLTRDGWVQAKDLKGKVLCTSTLFQAQSKNLTGKDITYIEERSIFQGEQLGCIEKFGNIITEISKKVKTYIIKTGTPLIIILLTLKKWIEIYTGAITKKNGINCILKKDSSRLPEIKLNAGLGTKAKRAENGIKKTMKKCKNYCIKEKKRNAFNAEEFLWGNKGKEANFVQTTVNQNGEENPESTMSKENVSYAANLLSSTNILKQKIVVENVRQHHEIKPTYCVTVPVNECFSLSNGIIVSNCRYSISNRVKRTNSIFAVLEKK